MRPTASALTSTPKFSQLLLQRAATTLYQYLQLKPRVELSRQEVFRVKIEEDAHEACVEFGVQLYGAPPNLPHLC